jgi:hypothetical protein
MPPIEGVLIPGSADANVQELEAQLTCIGAVIGPAEQKLEKLKLLPWSNTDLAQGDHLCRL